MMTLKLSEDNKISITNGRPSFLYDIDAVTQLIVLRLKSFKGEWFLNTEAGVPYFQTIFKKRTPFAYVTTIIQDTILETPGVLAIQSFNVEYDPVTREFTFDKCKIISMAGTITFNEVI